MKSNLTGSSPEACKATNRGDKACPVCQAWGGVSGLGSDLGSRSGPGTAPQQGVGPSLVPESGPGPAVVLGSRPGPQLVSGPRRGSSAIPRPGPGSAVVPEIAPGPGAVAEPGPGSSSVPGPGTVVEQTSGPSAVPGSGSGPRVVLGPGPRSGTVAEPRLRPVLVPGPSSGPDTVPRPGTVPGSGSGPGALKGCGLGPGIIPVLDPGTGMVPQLVLGLGSGLGTSSGSGSGMAPLPGSGSETRSRQESKAGPKQESGAGPEPSEPIGVPTPAPQQKTQAKPTHAPRQKVLVTGGGGYLGFSLGSTLAKSGASVTLLDLCRPQWELAPGTKFIQADIRNEEALYRAFEGVDCVFHIASYGMSGADKLQKEQTESINVGGTKLVIDVCIRRSVPRLIYTSTVHVAFGGKPIEQGDEDSVPYFPLEKHMDHYSRTKAIADQLILMANGTPLPGGGTLQTCVLRPPGIYGPEEQRHLPRVVNQIKKRLFVVRFGDRRARMNWVHVRNLVQAHVLAAEALTAAKGFVASGQAYYINDGESVNLFEWIAPLFEKLGYSQPWIQMPTSWVYLTATVMEYLHMALRPICSIPPLLTRSEVLSIAVTHTFQISKARTQLGYAPDKFSFAEAVDLYVQSTSGRPRGSTARTLLRRVLYLLLLLGLLALALNFLELQPLEAAVQRP